MTILSAVDAAHPQIISQIPGSYGQLTFRDRQLIVVSGYTSPQLQAFDLSNPYHPRLLSSTVVPYSDSLSTSGATIVLSGFNSGIEVLK